ncbi:RnaseH [uncultured Caudovirales phage]|uniref:RnaseH n=1 Tax=uncultured Caudovirales phage TaxID=2100421 RepID=A0A6J5LJM3_9CAUD|nr:RnaseH [uncultured Caudovirales phage]
MLLIDLNQVLLAGLMAQISNQKNKTLEEDLIRHMVLNIIRGHVKNFKGEYGEVILCCDNRKYWRKDYFPFYKAGRKKTRDKSDLDWHLIFDMLSKFKQELKDNFPYKVIDVDGAEADDIIGTLVPRYASNEKVLILSSDGDFLQLQRYGVNVKQYNPSQKKYVKSAVPMLELKEKIIRGDKGDGIPNIFSPADCFVRDLRQKPITQKVLDKYLNENVEDYSETDKANYIRNSTLIDLTNIPVEVKQRIIDAYDEAKPASKQKMLNYFIEYKLKNLMDVIEEF